MNVQDRNSIIYLAYLEDGYFQIEIANYLGLSKSAISMLIKNDKSVDFNRMYLGKNNSTNIKIFP